MVDRATGSDGRLEVLLLVGTRPEAVKVAPVALALAAHPTLRPVIVASGQHGAAVAETLAWFGLRPDEAFELRRATGGQAELMAALLPALDSLLDRRRPAVVLVQGDTTSTLAGALAAFWRQVPLAHLEAGLRTGDLSAPFPEEANRQLVARLASLHLAPTDGAAHRLRQESLPRPHVVLTANTVVDAIALLADRRPPALDPRLTAVEDDVRGHGARLVLVTAHRRESWGRPLDEVLAAVRVLAGEHPEVRVLFPVHPNPAVGAQVHDALAGRPRITLTPPLAYPDLLRALALSSLVLTDSGGIQEEAPSFGVPVVVLREVTERVEGVMSGHLRLTGLERSAILQAARHLLSSSTRLPRDNPFGDGAAAERVVAAIEQLVARADRPLQGAS